MVEASRIKSTKKKNRGKSRKNKKVKAGKGDGVVAGDGGNVGEFDDVAVAVHVLADEGMKKKKKKNKRAKSTAGTGVKRVVPGNDVVAGDDDLPGDDVVAGDDDLPGDDVVAGDDVGAYDDVVAGDDVGAYDDVVVDDDVEAGEGATLVAVADEGKKKENKRAGSEGKGVVADEGLGEAGKKRKKPSWEYVQIVAEVEEQLPPKRHRPQKKNEDFVSY